MLAFWCFSSIGLLMSLQYDHLKAEEENGKPSLQEIELQLDIENRALDREISDLLVQHRQLCKER